MVRPREGVGHPQPEVHQKAFQVSFQLAYQCSVQRKLLQVAQ